MSLANKYRPQTFDTIIGQEHITEILKAQMRSTKQLHHNYLLFGPRGTGKTTAARIIAKAINCLNPHDGNPCNTCINCQTINEGKTLDYIEIDAASHTGVDNIREAILDKASYPPASLKKKIYVIDEVHMLSKGAFNALLKTIEEPRNNVCFILATTELHKVPETIISRCQVFNFKKVSSPEMKKMLKWICQQENLSHTDDALEVIAKISEGCVRDAVKYVDQVSVLGDINEEHITKFLGVAPEGMIEEFLQMIKDSNKENIFTKIDEIHDQGVDLHNFAKQILMYMDQHFLENIDFFAQVSEAFTEIIGNIRYYPYPTIVYKIAINKHLNGVQSAECRVQNAEKKTPVVNPPSSIPAPGSQSSIPQSPQKSSEDNLQISITIPQSPQKDSTDHSSILSMLLEKMQHNTLRDNLQDQIAIEEVTENKVKIIAINKIAEMMLKKPENITIVQKSLSEILGREVMIEVKFENKENYFARKLG